MGSGRENDAASISMHLISVDGDGMSAPVRCCLLDYADAVAPELPASRVHLNRINRALQPFEKAEACIIASHSQ